MTQKTLNRLTFAVAVVMFFAAIFVLYRELENTRLVDVIANFEALPKARVILAIALTAASHLLLTWYDFLALSYANHKLRPRETLFTSLISFSFNAPRRRLYFQRRRPGSTARPQEQSWQLQFLTST